MRKNNFLSISELASISGVNAKSLRYYDHIGILRPVFVDPDTGYRYYAFFQKEQVDAIQLCVEMGIPLKHFSDFNDNENPHFLYGRLISKGIAYTSEKIHELQSTLSRLQYMQDALARAEDSYAQELPKTYTLPERTCWTVPYHGTQFCDAAQELLRKIILEINRQGLKIGYSNGLILAHYDNEWKQFMFVDIDTDSLTDETEKHKEILHIPESRYLCKKIEHSGTEQAFIWSSPYIEKEQISLIVETELFIGNYYFPQPPLEQQCLLKPG